MGICMALWFPKHRFYCLIHFVNAQQTSAMGQILHKRLIHPIFHTLVLSTP